MKQQLIETQYNGIECHFTEDGWFNATEAADKFGRRLDKWVKAEDTKEYITALCEVLNTPNKGDLIKTKRGNNGGTWLHPKLAVAFARWLDPKFSIWCDVQIDNLIRGEHQFNDWSRLRHEAASSFKVMNQILDMSRQAEGKSTASYHYMNEAKMINSLLSGEHKGLDRESLNSDELKLLAVLEVKNTLLIGQGVSYQNRKIALQEYAQELKTKKLH